MQRGSFSRTVARAAASGGGRAYRARRPRAWYALITVICIASVFLIVYSRNERLHPKSVSSVGPSATANWNVAIGFDICGSFTADLPANSNLSTVGIRTFGNGLINIDPSVASKPADYEGKKAVLGLFVSDYKDLTLTDTTLKLPMAKQKLWKNGDACATSKASGNGRVAVEVWPSVNATSGTVLTSGFLSHHFSNGEMITVAFLPTNVSIAKPPSETALRQTLGLSAKS